MHISREGYKPGTMRIIMSEHQAKMLREALEDWIGDRPSPNENPAIVRLMRILQEDAQTTIAR